MKTRMAIAGVALLATIAVGAAEKWDDALESEVETAIGTFTAEAVEGSTDYHLLLDGKELLRNEGASVFMSPVIKGKTHDFMLAFVSTGGTACLGEFVVWRVQKPVVLSKKFGTCSDVFKARTVGDRLIVTMPGYLAHPDLVTETQRKRAGGAEAVATYTYENGVLTGPPR